MCEQWPTWMMTNNFTTPSGNWKKPTEMDCLNWVVKAWEQVGSAGIRKKAKELGMTSDPGPVVEGYVDHKFNDEPADGKEGDVYILALERDFAKDDD